MQPSVTPGDVLVKIHFAAKPKPHRHVRDLCEVPGKRVAQRRMRQVGASRTHVDDRIPLATVFVDLPTLDESAGLRAQILEDTDVDFGYPHPRVHHGEGFIKETLGASSELLDPTSLGTSVISNNLDPAAPRGSRGRFVLVGGPGQGKPL